MAVLSDYYHKNEGDSIWWVHDFNHTGHHLFSFDKKKIYNLFRDYPNALSAEELELFNKENPYWMAFFKYRLPPEMQEQAPDISSFEDESDFIDV